MNIAQIDERDGRRNRRQIIGEVLWAGWVNNGRNGGNVLKLEDESTLVVWSTGTMNGGMVDRRVGTIGLFTLVEERGWDQPICIAFESIQIPTVIPAVVEQLQEAVSAALEDTEDDDAEFECHRCGVVLTSADLLDNEFCPACGKSAF